MSKLFKVMMAMVCIAGMAVTAQAQIVINQPFTGSDVTVTGSGAPSLAPVELIVNGESQGSVVADGSGRFAFPGQTIAINDELQARVAQVWNFNENDNDEGWRATNFNTDGLTTSVQNGIFTATFDARGEITFGIGTADLIADPLRTRVVEIRYRLTSVLNPGANQTVQFSQVGADGEIDPADDPAPDDVATFGQGFNLAPSTEFRTSLVDMSTLNTGNPSPWTNGQDVVFLAFGAFGLSAGDTFEVDYVRVTDGYYWEFENDNDPMLFGVNEFLGNGATLSVANGAMTLTTVVDAASTTNTSAGAPAINQPFNWVDSDYFRVLSTRKTVNGPGVAQFEQMQWIDKGGTDNFGANGNIMTKLYTDDGATTDSVIDLPTHTNFDGSTPTWGEDPTAMQWIYQPYLNSELGGETAVIDYLRLLPLNASGISEPVVVTGEGPVNRAESWMIFE